VAIQKNLYRCVSTPSVSVTPTPDRLKAEREAAGKPLFLVMGENAAVRAALCGALPVDWRA
jgi:hypothetical protein